MQNIEEYFIMGGRTHGKDTSQVLEEVKRVHGNNLCYERFEYKNCKTKVIVGCKKHNGSTFYFDKWPNDLKKGSGCPKCSKNYRRSTEEFREEISQKYPNYEVLTEYKNSHTKVLVKCLIHGDFSIKPNDLLNGSGCRKCGVDKMLDTKIANGSIRHPDDIDARAKYKQEVWKYTEREYKEYMSDQKRDRRNHLDHVYSIHDGFHNNVPPEIIGSHINLRILSGPANRKKSHKSDITLEQLMELYKNA